MFGSVVLDVAIGLALLFLFVSLICAAIREAIETVLNARSADLERGIREMLDDPTGQGATSALYAHPLIYPLYRGDYRPDQLRPQRSVPGAHAGPHMSRRMSLRGRASLPAYIPSRSFARAYLDLQVRGPVGTAGHPAPALTVAALAEKAQAMPDGRPRRALLAALDQGGDSLHKVEHAVALWFDSCMDRVSGWYKRRTQMMLFVIGLVVAGVMNVDAFSVGRALFEDEALRGGVVAQATALVLPVPSSPDRSDDQIARRAAQAFAALQGELGQIRFPTGWGRPLPRRIDGPGALAQLLLGWLVTAFAVMLGAPFWFDLLSRFVVVRSAAKPQ
jgi:hypothetical protein